ncbi:MAG: sugar ABC transporter permease [Planctomycetota bacterium]
MRRDGARVGLLFTAPFWIGFALFTAVPVGLSLYYGTTDYDLVEAPLPIGLANFGEMAGDAVFWTALRNTLVFAACSVALNTVVALALALLLEQRLRGREFVRALVFAPTLVPISAVAVGWLWLFHRDEGLINAGLRIVGVQGPDWLGDARWALWSLVGMSAWVVGAQVLVYTAALRDVPRSLVEAAAIDGANARQRLLRVVLPQISPAVAFNVLVSIIWALQVFALPLIMTRGGPQNTTLVYSMYVWQNAFQYGRMGYASALAWVQFAVTCALTAAAVALARKRVYARGATAR